jgi:hypothetical protein
MLREVKLDYRMEVRRLAVKPNSIGKGNPGNMPFLSNILNANKHPNKMPMIEATHGIGLLNFSSMWPESKE